MTTYIFTLQEDGDNIFTTALAGRGDNKNLDLQDMFERNQNTPNLPDEEWKLKITLQEIKEGIIKVLSLPNIPLESIVILENTFS